MKVTRKANLVCEENKWKSLNQFDFVRENGALVVLGKGSYATVYKIQTQYKGKVKQLAVKVCKKNKLKKIQVVATEVQKFGDPVLEDVASLKRISAYERIKAELRIQSHVDHLGIVLLYEVIDDPDYDELFIIMELIKFGDIMKFNSENGSFKIVIPQLLDRIRDTSDQKDTTVFNEEVMGVIFYQLLSALECLHKKNIAHLDLKPSNILINKIEGNDIWGIKASICDFGMAVQLEDPRDKISCSYGTLHFGSPESCTGAFYDPFAADIWAMGVCFYIFLWGMCPFHCGKNNMQNVLDKIQKRELTYTNCAGTKVEVDSVTKEFLHCMLTVDPKKRATIPELKKHEFFEKFPPKRPKQPQARKMPMMPPIDQNGGFPPMMPGVPPSGGIQDLSL